jgi:hypothetical protein
MHNQTIIAAPQEPYKVRDLMLVEHPRFDLLPNGQPGRRHFKIRSADFYACRHSANVLLRQRYSWRGYHAVSLPADQTANRITLTAIEDSATIGTITVGLDGPEGMGCEDVFAAEVEALRADGRHVCEFTKLAVDASSSTKRVLAGLFHVAYIVAHRIRGFDTLVMEVNPRHVRYYERMLGARVIGEERLNRSVNAPAVLLSIDFDYIMTQIAELAGQPERAVTERSLYPFAFTPAEEQGIIARLMAAQKPASMAVN